MDLGLKDRRAIVCGASAGIGLAIAESLTCEGAKVAMVARREELLAQQARRLGALPVRADITDPGDLSALVTTTVTEFGGIDILVNNGGGPRPGPAETLSDAAIAEAVDLLLLSVVRLTRLCLPFLVDSGVGRVINICSVAVREPIDNLALSNAIRPGVVGWAKTLAREVGPRQVTVNSIAPGRIETDRVKEIDAARPDGPAGLERIPLRRYGLPTEVGDVVCFIASERASYITGAVISVDGGISRSLA